MSTTFKLIERKKYVKVKLCVDYIQPLFLSVLLELTQMSDTDAFILGFIFFMMYFCECTKMSMQLSISRTVLMGHLEYCTSEIPVQRLSQVAMNLANSWSFI